MAVTAEERGKGYCEANPTTEAATVNLVGVAGSHRLSSAPNDWRFSCEPQRLRGPTEAPKFQCQTLPEVDWNVLWLVSCNRLLGSRRVLPARLYRIRTFCEGLCMVALAADRSCEWAEYVATLPQ